MGWEMIGTCMAGYADFQVNWPKCRCNIHPLEVLCAGLVGSVPRGEHDTSYLCQFTEVPQWVCMLPGRWLTSHCDWAFGMHGSCIWWCVWVWYYDPLLVWDQAEGGRVCGGVHVMNPWGHGGNLLNISRPDHWQREEFGMGQVLPWSDT